MDKSEHHSEPLRELDGTLGVGVVQARKLSIVVRAVFADASGTVETLEGPVDYAAGDAVVHGPTGSGSWPVERARFLAGYEPMPPIKAGEDGEYKRIPAIVTARLMNVPFTALAGRSGSVLHGKPGDWLVEYGPAHFGVVAADVFSESYELLKASDNNQDSNPAAD